MEEERRNKPKPSARNQVGFQNDFLKSIGDWLVFCYAWVSLKPPVRNLLERVREDERDTSESKSDILFTMMMELGQSAEHQRENPGFIDIV